MPTLSLADVRRARMASQRLGARPAATGPEDVVAWFGAMQAQDYHAALWALGVRLPGLRRSAVEDAVAGGAIVRTWAMRGTLHFVAARDARWMLRTAGARALRTSSQRWRTLGLDQACADAAVEVLRGALAHAPLLTRSALLDALEAGGIGAGGQRGYHLLRYAAQIGVTCLGPDRGGEQTYALLDAWAPGQRELDGDEALGELVLRYFRSHGPATRQDFQRWTGVTAAAARTGLAVAGDALTVCQAGGEEVFVDPAALDRPSAAAPDRPTADPAALDRPFMDPAAHDRPSPGPTAPIARLLPAFDEFVIGYQDRSAVIPPDRIHDVVPGNSGLFRPALLVDGRIAGTWSRSVSARGVRITVRHFDQQRPAVVAAVAEAMAGYADYLSLPLLD